MLAPSAWASRARRQCRAPERAHPMVRERGAQVANAAMGVQAPGALAERVGFEPTNSFESALFKSAAFNRSATSPSGQDTGAPPVGPSTRRSGLHRP